MDHDFECAYRNAKDDRSKLGKVKIENNRPRGKPLNLIKKLFLSKKYNDSLVKKLSSGELTVAQLKQVNRAIKSGLSDKQLDSIINCKKDASRMSVIIDIAISVNKREVKADGR